MNHERYRGGAALFAAIRCAVEGFLALLVAVPLAPTGHGERLDIFRLNGRVQQRLPWWWLVPDKHPFACVIDGVQRSSLALGVYPIAHAHHPLNGAAVLAPPGKRGGPGHHPRPLPPPLLGVVWGSEGMRPSTPEGVDAGGQVQLWN